MCSIFICTAQSDHHSPTPETVFFLHVYIPNKHIYTNNFSFINKDNSIQQVNHNYTTSFCWHSWQTNLQPFPSPEQERLVITLHAVSFPDLMTFMCSLIPRPHLRGDGWLLLANSLGFVSLQWLILQGHFLANGQMKGSPLPPSSSPPPPPLHFLLPKNSRTIISCSGFRLS